MYPRTKAGEEKYRHKKRIIEINLILDHITRFAQSVYSQPRDLQILEFGSGPGFQISYLEQLGRVVGSDIYISDGIYQKLPQIEFSQCSITDTPFEDAQFDLLFSNHVIEHIPDLPRAFAEMKRIGHKKTIYAFSIPTNIWLLLSLPAKYYLKVRKVFEYVSKTENGQPPQPINPSEQPTLAKKSIVPRALDKLTPKGHGEITDFAACYEAFKIDSWRKLFEEHGFIVKEIQPLLLYASSEWPIVPITGAFNRFNVCSSVLFLMHQR